MASLAFKDSYLQSLARKVCTPDSSEQWKPKRAHVRLGEEQHSTTKEKKKKKPRRLKKDGSKHPAGLSSPFLQKAQRPAMPSTSFSTVDILRKRLHEKIEESRGQVFNKSLSAEEIEKRRQRRKHERKRKKRKRKELQLKETQEAAVGEDSASEKIQDNDEEKKLLVPIVFNKVEVHDEPLNKVMQKKKKKELVKGNITPMTGKNYKQLLNRLEARKSKLEQLRAKDQDKAKQFESKIKWTNVLYKAEGIKIKDDEGMLKTALKRKEKQREQRKKRWDKRTLQTCEKMQRRQDKRTRNIKKKKVAKVEKKKNRARKRGRIMPEDLAKASA